MGTLKSFLSEVQDPRRRQGRRYELEYVMLFTILAVLSGAFSYRKVQKFIDMHIHRLNKEFGLNWKRSPAYTSIRDMWQALDEGEVERAFRIHARSLVVEKENQGAKECISCDGKTLRGSFDRFHDQKAAHVVSALSHDGSIILGHLAVSEKSNEIPAVQELIGSLGLTGKVFTLDAMHCQKNL